MNDHVNDLLASLKIMIEEYIIKQKYKDWVQEEIKIDRH